jgi:hypothetical protein
MTIDWDAFTAELELRAFKNPVPSDGILMRRAAARIQELEAVCGEAYQVVGSLASDAGVFGTDEVDKALTNLSNAAMTHKDVLPFPSHPTRTSELEQRICDAMRVLSEVLPKGGEK